MTSTPPENQPPSPSPAPPREPASATPAPDTSDISAPTGPYPGAPYAQPGPFAPVVRQPRVPWVNPDRRSHILGAGVLGGLVVLAVGFGIGYAVAPSGHDGHGPMMRMERGGGHYGPAIGPVPGGQFPGPGNGQRRQRVGVPSASPSSATPTPSSTK